MTVGTRRRSRISALGLTSTVVLIVLGILILVPAVFVLIGAFTENVPRPGSGPLSFTLGNFAVLAEEGVAGAVLNSLLVGVFGTVLALLIGSLLAFVVARTDTPGRPLLYAIGVVPLFLPSYVGALAWSMLGSPSAGLINIAFDDLGLPISIDVYSLPGMVFVLGIFYAPYAFLLVHSTLSMTNPDLEDAATVHGSPLRKVLTGVTVPLALPALLGSGLLIFSLVVENFPVAQTLGTPGGVDTLPTFIYRLMNTFPSRGNQAAAVAIVLVAVVLAATFVQRKIIAKRDFTTVTGKGMRPRTVRLGWWRWIALGSALCYFLVAIVLPVGALLLTSIRTNPYLSSFADLAKPGALDFGVFSEVFASNIFREATVNSVLVSVVAALVGLVVAFVIVYLTYRTRTRLRGWLEIASMVPLAIPAIVLGMGLLWTWLVAPLPVYGTLAVLVIAFVAAHMPQGFRGLAGSMLQTDRDLEDGAVLLGARRARAIGYVTLPLMRVGLTSTFVLLLMLSMRELTVPIFLYTADTQIVSIAIFDEFENGGALQEASAISLLYCLVILALSYLPRLFGGKAVTSGL